MNESNGSGPLDLQEVVTVKTLSPAMVPIAVGRSKFNRVKGKGGDTVEMDAGRPVGVASGRLQSGAKVPKRPR